MNVSRISKRMAATGIATALAAGALVGAGSTAATAVTGARLDASSTYICAMGGSPIGQFPMTASVPFLPPTINAGTAVPADLLSMDAVLNIPAAVVPTLMGAGVTGGAVPDFGMLMGTQAVPAPLTLTGLASDGVGGLDASATGKNGAFSTPKAGTYDVTLPSSFTFIPSTGAGPLPLQIVCTTDSPGKLTSIQVDKNYSALDAKAPKKIKKSKRAKVVSMVTNENRPATGKIIAKLGKKTVGKGAVKNGKSTMKLSKLKPGRYTIKVNYLGDAYTAPSTDSFKMKVVK